MDNVVTERTPEWSDATTWSRFILRRIYLLVAVVALVVVASMVYVYFLGSRIANTQVPLIDGAKEIELQVTAAHLWLAEVINGYRVGTIDEAYEHLDQADRYASAMLNGGQVAEDRFHPLGDPFLRGEITAVRDELVTFRAITRRYWQMVTEGGGAPDVGRQYHATFDGLVQKTQALEALLERHVASEFRHFRVIQLLLIGVCLIVTLAVGLMFGHVVRHRERAEIALQTANEQLDASNRQLRESEAKVRNLAKFPHENPDPVLRLARDGTVIYANPVAQTVLADFGAGRHSRVPEVWGVCVETILAEGTNREAEIQCGDRTYLMVLVPVVEAGYVNVYGRDITERKAFDVRLRSLVSQLTTAEERERKRLAGILHDGFIQSLALSKMRLEQAALSAPAAETKGIFDDAVANILDLIGEMRSVTFELCSPVLYTVGLEAAIQDWLDHQVRGKHETEFRYEDDGQPRQLDEDLRFFLFRAARELCTNVIRHADAVRAEVRVRTEEGMVRIDVEDDGVGPLVDDDDNRDPDNGGLGLFGIRERLKLFNGTMHIEPRPEGGTRVTLKAPLTTPADRT